MEQTITLYFSVTLLSDESQNVLQHWSQSEQDDAVEDVLGHLPVEEAIDWNLGLPDEPVTRWTTWQEKKGSFHSNKIFEELASKRRFRY